jgi:hypothetical protein
VREVRLAIRGVIRYNKCLKNEKAYAGTGRTFAINISGKRRVKNVCTDHG